jgi:hypothetical protein
MVTATPMISVNFILFSGMGGARHPVHPARRGRPRRLLAIAKFRTI